MTKPTVLVVDDDEAIRVQCRWALSADYDVLLAADRATAIETFRAQRPALSLLDLGLPPDPDQPEEGLATLAAIRGLDNLAKVIVVSGLGQHEASIRAVGEGACGYLSKPLNMQELKLLLRQWIELALLEREYHERHLCHGPESIEGIQGASPRMQEVLAIIHKVAATDVPVLILGENGTGRQTAARAIHRLSGRREGVFLDVDCGALDGDLLDRELFGEALDSTAGDPPRRPGRFEQAAGGTLYLRQVDQLPLPLQLRLFRFLQHNAIEPVGGGNPIPVDVRLIAAARGELAQLRQAGRFRDDLYYRLAVVVIHMPALRERRQDIVPLAETFLRQFAGQYGKEPLRLDAGATRVLERYPWPGNVRELQNCLRRAVIVAEGGLLCDQDLDLQCPAPSTPIPTTGLKAARRETEREMVLQALHKHHDKIAPAAAELGITRPTFYALMHKLGITRPTGSGADSCP